MNGQTHRAERGGRIDRSAPLAFTFDGARHEGYEGDTLASALLANGVRLVGRSFKYHRRRGIFGAGSEEPNALVRVRGGARAEPNLKATQVELYDGLAATSQNRWPSLEFDVGALSNVASKLLPAGFYYKTFMWPGSWWMLYEHFIRKAAGLGRAPNEPDPDHYDRRYAFCDVLVAGAGPAGLMAALAAARSGARVILVDDAPVLGGSLLASTATIEDGDPMAFVSRIGEELASCPNVRVLSRTTALGYYDDNMIVALERRADHVAEPPEHSPRQRLWWIRAKEVVLATGAIERPLPFEDNDLPGVMLASAARTYAFQYGVRLGDRCVIGTNNDSAYEAIEPMLNTGTNIIAVVDAREDGPGSDASAVVQRFGVELIAGSVVMRANRPYRRRRCGSAIARVGRGVGRGRIAAHALRSRLCLGRLESHRPSVLAIAGPAAVRCRARGVRAGREHAARTLGRFRARTAEPVRVPGRRRRGRRRCGPRRGLRGGVGACLSGRAASGTTAPPRERSGRCRSHPGVTASASSTSRTT